jgi:hypothetical protein
VIYFNRHAQTTAWSREVRGLYHQGETFSSKPTKAKEKTRESFCTLAGFFLRSQI